MNKCSDDCNPACDFCVYYEKKIDEDGCFESGFCTVLKREMDFGKYCSKFHCFRCGVQRGNKEG